MSRMFDFKEQINQGNKGEELILKHYHSPLVLIPEHYADFRRVTDGKIVELKTDSYALSKTPNFFIEAYSDYSKKSPGGVWQSAEKGVHIFLYLFIQDRTYYEFDLKALVKHLTPVREEYEARRKFKFIRNRAWTTAGFPYPREKLKHLYREYRFPTSSSRNSASQTAGGSEPSKEGNGSEA